MPRLPRQEIRRRAWNLPDARRERRAQRREFNSEAREVGAAFTLARQEGRIGEAEIIALDVRNANLRALEARGIPRALAIKHGFVTEDWNSKGIQNVLRKYDNLRAKGFTAVQSLAELERRAHKVSDLFREARSSDLMILAREFYTREQRLARMRRKNRSRKVLEAA